jgi:hypothetical protein
MKIQQHKSILCMIPEPSLLESLINLLARLLIIGSFGYLGVNRHSSAFERYLQVVSRDFVIIVVKAFLLVTLASMGIIFVLILVSPHFTSSPCITALTVRYVIDRFLALSSTSEDTTVNLC